MFFDEPEHQIPATLDLGQPLGVQLDPALIRLDGPRQLLERVVPRIEQLLQSIERWVDAAALEAHQRAATARTYRAALNPMLGALYDERIYRNLD